MSIKIRKSKDRQHNGQKKKDKKTNNDLQNIHIKLKIDLFEPTKNREWNQVLRKGNKVKQTREIKTIVQHKLTQQSVRPCALKNQLTPLYIRHFECTLSITRRRFYANIVEYSNKVKYHKP